MSAWPSDWPVSLNGRWPSVLDKDAIPRPHSEAKINADVKSWGRVCQHGEGLRQARDAPSGLDKGTSVADRSPAPGANSCPPAKRQPSAERRRPR